MGYFGCVGHYFGRLGLAGGVWGIILGEWGVDALFNNARNIRKNEFLYEKIMVV